MKANKNLFMRKDTSAQVGIGTLIIFIAMVLVAAVAAAVLIQTSGVLQQKAQTTGKQTTEEVSSNIMVTGVSGLRSNNNSNDLSSTIDLLKVQLELNAGSGDVDLNQIVVSITDGSATNDLIYANNDKTIGAMAGFSSTSASGNLDTLLTGTSNGSQYFVLDKIRDEDQSFSQSEPVMNTGDLVIMYISTMNGSATGYDLATAEDKNLTTSGLVLEPRTDVTIHLTPEVGSSTTVNFVSPSTYGVKETLSLYP
ncbi:MAG: archaellin/type IV pilin N-terminal domain-containing protein [Euryarchaeota archaeon]|nr:archaellin/type IV pilin N-terminal domain-containing protein [Euryarchaeota archaeon]